MMTGRRAESGRPRILVAESSGFSETAAGSLRAAGELRLADLDRRGLLAQVGDFDALWVRLRHRIDAEVLTAAPRLRFLATPTTGLDHVDTGLAAARGVQVVALRGEEAFLRDVRATAEHTLALSLALVRSLPAAVDHVRAGGWDRDRFWGTEIHGKTVGIVGYGRLGRLVARSMGALDATVLATDPALAADDFAGSVESTSMPDLLERSDIVTLHASLTTESRRLIGRLEFARMKQGALLVNTARGALVDEPALLDALRSGPLGGAALDVLADEHTDGNSELVAYAREHPNLLITPHIGGSTVESREKTERFIAERLAEALAQWRQ